MSDYRSHIRTEWPPERITEALEELSQATTERSHNIRCKFCNKDGNYKIQQRDGKVVLEAIRFAAEHGYGRAAQAKETDTSPIDLGKPIDQMSQDERTALKQQLQARLGNTTDKARVEAEVRPT